MANQVLANQDDPAGSYVTFTADPNYCFPAVSRSPVVFPMSGDSDAGAGIEAKLIDSITIENNGTVTIVVGAGDVGAGTHNKPYLAPLALRGIQDPVFGPPVPGSQVTAITVTHPPTAASATNAANVNIPETTASYTITKAGNTALCFIAYDPAGGESITAVSTESNGDFTKLDTVTIGGSTGYKLETWALKNAAHAVTQDVFVTNAKSPTLMTKAIVATVEISSDSADPSDITLSATGTDDRPVTAASADTAAANEVFVSALLVAGVPTAEPGGLEDSFVTHIEKDQYGNQPVSVGTSFSLYIYRQNFIAVGNYGFSCSLPEAHDWAISTHSFK